LTIKAEYIWIDGTEPTPLLRSKTKVLTQSTTDLPIWGFDGSSTNQAPGKNSDCVLKPVFSCPDPIRGGGHLLVLCEVLLPDYSPHPTNTRSMLVDVVQKFASQEPLFGLEQEYTMFKGSRPLGFPDPG
jgi:glutamine synthetase